MLDLMATSRRADRPLLGADAGALTLRVCGGSHRGRLISIRSPKCTIGSAAGCTLRLRAAGVRPLHCWILRGPAGTVVRRCTAGTLLNGLTYEDAPLQNGDRLRVGPVELEIIECQSSPPQWSIPAAPEPDASESPSNRASTRELEACLAAANDEIARLEADAKQAWQTSVVAAERADQLREALEEANVETGEVRGELEAALSALKRERAEGEPRLSSMRQQLEQAQRKLAEAEATMIQAQRQMEEQSSRPAAEREALQRQIAQLQRELEQARSQAMQSSQMTISMGSARAKSQEEASDWESRCTALSADVARLETELSAARAQQSEAAQWQARLAEADQQVEHWQAEAQRRQLLIENQQQQLALAVEQLAKADESSRQQVADEDQQLANRRTALEERERQLESGRLQLEASQRQLEASQIEIETAEARLLERQSQINKRQSEFEAEQCTKSAALNDREALLSAQAEKLQDQLDELAVQLTELEEAKEQLAQAVSDCESRQQQLAALEAELTARRQPLEASREELPPAVPAAEDVPRPSEAQYASDEPQGASVDDSASDGSDANVDSVLSRLVRAGVWRDGEGHAAEPTPSVAEPTIPIQQRWREAPQPGEAVREEPSSVEVVPDSDFPPQPLAPLPATPFEAPQQKHEAANQDDESIESYMERLLQRVRGDAGDAPKPAAPAPAPAYQASQPAPAEESHSEPAAAVSDKPPAALVNPEEFVPRSQAPEMTSDLAAMRELANSAARSAIAKHQRKTTGKHVTGRLVGIGVVLAASGALAYWAWSIPSITAAVGASVGFTASLYWCTRALGRMMSSARLHRPYEAPAAQAPGAAVSDPSLSAEPIAESAEQA